MNKCCKKIMIGMIEDIIRNMKHAQFKKQEEHIQALEFALSMLKDKQ